MSEAAASKISIEDGDIFYNERMNYWVKATYTHDVLKMVRFDRLEEVERLNTKPDPSKSKHDQPSTKKTRRDPNTQNKVVWKTFNAPMLLTGKNTIILIIDKDFLGPLESDNNKEAWVTPDNQTIEICGNPDWQFTRKSPKDLLPKNENQFVIRPSDFLNSSDLPENSNGNLTPKANGHNKKPEVLKFKDAIDPQQSITEEPFLNIIKHSHFAYGRVADSESRKKEEGLLAMSRADSVTLNKTSKKSLSAYEVGVTQSNLQGQLMGLRGQLCGEIMGMDALMKNLTGELVTRYRNNGEVRVVYHAGKPPLYTCAKVVETDHDVPSGRYGDAQPRYIEMQKVMSLKRKG
jgi:hypothetical protein